VAAAVDLLPPTMRRQLGLERHRFSQRDRMLLRLLAKGASRFELPSSPARQALARLAAGRGVGQGALATS